MTTQDIIVATLNDLIETSRDGELGFSACARHAASPQLQSLFAKRADECRAAARDLEAKLQQYGVQSPSGGSTIGALHRGWVAVRGSLFGFTDQALLDECERGEDAALDRYRAALKDDKLPDALQRLVQDQLRGVQNNHDQIKALREHLNATT